MSRRHRRFRRRLRRSAKKIRETLRGLGQRSCWLRLPRRSHSLIVIALVIVVAGLTAIGAKHGAKLLEVVWRKADTDGSARVAANRSILITGGYDSSLSAVTANAEIYDLDTRRFASTGAMTTPRANHTATLLTNGKVLITGGASNADFISEGGILRTAELYDPATGKFTPTGSMNFERAGHAATLLPNGKVLIVGGLTNNEEALAIGELYDPKRGKFAAIDRLTDPRIFPTVTMLDSGELLIAGGEVLAFSGPIRDIANVVHDRLNTAEIFSAAMAGFKCVGGASFLGAVCRPSMLSHRLHHTSTLLRNGRVLLAGGEGDCLTYKGRAELFDPETGIFLAANEMAAGRQQHTATMLSDGQVLLAGGMSPCNANSPPVEAELYDPNPAQPPVYNGVFSPAASLSEPRAAHTATLIPSGPDKGSVLIAGGSINGNATAELYVPGAETFACIGGVSDSPPLCNASMIEPRRGHTATLLAVPPQVKVGR